MDQLMLWLAVLGALTGALLLVTGRAIRGVLPADPPDRPLDWRQDSHFMHTQGMR